MMRVVFCNNRDDMISIHNVEILEFDRGIRLSFRGEYFVSALALLNPSSHLYSVNGMYIDLEGEYMEYSHNCEFKGYYVKGRLYKFVEIHNE